MMARTASEPVNTVQAQPGDSGCCQVKSEKPAPVSQLLAPIRQSCIARPATQVITAEDVIAPMIGYVSLAASPPPLAPSQSVLCNFLI